jgi:hypothetical protein
LISEKRNDRLRSSSPNEIRLPLGGLHHVAMAKTITAAMRKKIERVSVTGHFLLFTAV